MNVNPYTLKELRQLTRSRFITGSLVAYLYISLGISYFLPIGGIGQDTGSELFAALNSILLVMLGLVLPASTYARMSSERGTKGANADFTLLTAIPPAGVIDGKLRSAFSLMALFAAATLPFAVLAYLLHGVTFANMLSGLSLTVAYSCVMVHIAVATASMKLSRIFRHVVFFLIFIAQIFSTAGTAFVSRVVSESADWGELAIVLAAAATICVMLRAYAIAYLSPSVMERDARIKAWMLIALALWGVYTATFAPKGLRMFNNAIGVWLGSGAAGVMILAGYALSQPTGYSRRILAARAKLSRLRRFITWPWSSGATNTFIFAVAIAAVLSAVEPLSKPWFDATVTANACGGAGPNMLDKPYELAIVFMYVFALMLVIRAIWRFISRSVNVQPLIVPTISLMIFVFLQSMPWLLAINGLSDPEDYFNMPFVLRGISDFEREHLVYSAIAFGCGVLVNLRAFLRALRAK